MLLEGQINGMKFKDEDVINWGDYHSPDGTVYNKPWLIYNEYGTLCIVFARCEQDALDEAADNDKLKGHLIDEDDKDYDAEAGTYHEEEVNYVGNNGKPCDMTNLNIIELPNPKLSLVGMYAVLNTEATVKVFEKHKADHLLPGIEYRYLTDTPSARQCIAYLEMEQHKADNERFPGLLADLKKIK